MLTLRTGIVAAAALLASAVGVQAQNYPDRTVKIVVPFGPAGSYDLVGRALADQLSKRMGQTFVVENKPGAGSILGTQFAVTSPADGYTLLVGGLSNIAFNSGLYQKLSYDPINDLTPVAMVFNISYTLVGRKDLPHATVKEIIEVAKKNPTALKLAHVGIGSGQHVVGAAFQKLAGVTMQEIPYRGTAQAMPDLLGGRVDLFFDSTPAAMPYVQSGQVKGVAILTAKRHSKMPDVPTLTESGVPGLEIDSWLGLFAPAKTPPEVIARLQREIAQMLPDLKQPFENAGGEVMNIPAAQLPAFVKGEHDRWVKVIKDAGIKLD